MQALKVAQMQGEVKKVPANNADEIKDAHFKQYEGHMINEHETHIYHVAMEARLFSTSTGEKLSRSRVQKFDKKNFENMKEGNGFNGWTIHILHNPEMKLVEKEKTLADIKGVGEKKAELLIENGVKNLAVMANLSPIDLEELDKVDGLTKEELTDFVSQAKNLLA